jgi:hypothetical protein
MRSASPTPFPQDPLSRLPLIPEGKECHSSSSSRRTKQKASRRLLAVQLANRAILALRALFSGELSGLLLDPPRSRTSREWEAAPLSARTASDNVLRDVNLFLNGVEGVAPAEEAAFRRLTRNVGVLKSYGASVRFGSPVSGDGEPLR